MKKYLFADVIPNVRDHGVKPPPASEANRKGSWVYLSDNLKRSYLSHFARWGDWSPTVTRCYEIPPAVQEEAERLRARFLRDPRRHDWLGDYPGTGE